MTETDQDQMLRQAVQKAEAARIMAESAVGHAMALRVLVTGLLAGVELDDETRRRLLAALVPRGQDPAKEFQQAVLRIVDDISTVAQDIASRSMR